MRKKTISILIIALFGAFNSQAQVPTATERANMVNLLIDMACWFNEQFKSGKTKVWEKDEISAKPVPTLMSDAELEKQLLLFRKSLYLSRFFPEDGKFGLHYDEAQGGDLTTKYEFLCKKMTTDKNKMEVLPADKPTPLTTDWSAIQTSFKTKDKIIKVEGELIIKHYKNFQTLTFTKADIGKSKTFNGVKITLKSLENGFCSYETGTDSTISVCYFSKNKESLETSNSVSVSKLAYEPILSDYTYNQETGCKVSDAVRKQFEQLAFDLEAHKVMDKTTVTQTVVKGTIDYITFYALSDLTIKRYKVEVLPKK
jgi:hypothetical protein